ncbi:gluconate 5-dehydrogenase [Yersinia similis]|nr:gluconate 5-dehydrogenase [Yersinia similis]
MDVFTASLRSACSLRRGHFVNNLKSALALFLLANAIA